MSIIGVCSKCKSEKIIPGVRVLDFGHHDLKRSLSVEIQENRDALFFKESFVVSLRARVCGDCGYTELYADQPHELYESYQRSKEKRG